MSLHEMIVPDLLAGDLEGSTNVQLAPVKGKDLRRSLPRKYFVKKPALFVSKFVFAMTLIALGWCSVGYALLTPVTVGGSWGHAAQWADLRSSDRIAA
ncbi:hypothetical protein [Photorhabdus africana]|uniref:hypothetical protein n=1 Tax=Photorhabdus africana TaxID=3097554 RepID=UPI002B4015F2|nr:hypothetical protein [Photorhabdus sp. CRI-LC]